MAERQRQVWCTQQGFARALRWAIGMTAYYGFARYLPKSSARVVGRVARGLRLACARCIFEFCGANVNIERKAYFGTGRRVRIGDNSGIGVGCVIPEDTVIGRNVMMGPYVHVFARNHEFGRIDIPMIEQGYQPRRRTQIEDDVWIGQSVIFTPGRTVKRGTVLAAGAVVTRDFPEFSIVGGNPARLIRDRSAGHRVEGT